MDEFMTVEYLTSFAGSVAFVAIATQVLKNYMPQNIDTKWLTLVLSIVVTIFRLILVGDYSQNTIIMSIVNIFIILIASSGAYEVVKSALDSIKK